MNLIVTYKGRSYNSITDAFMKAAVDGVKESLTRSLRPFKAGIRKCGGSVTIDVPENLKNANIQLQNMPQDLIDRITRALR